MDAQQLMNMDIFVHHLIERDFGLLTHREQHYLQDHQKANEDRVKFLLIDTLPTKATGENCRNVLETFYLSLRDSCERNCLSRHYYLAQLTLQKGNCLV